MKLLSFESIFVMYSLTVSFIETESRNILVSRSWKKHSGDCRRRPITPSPFPVPWPTALLPTRYQLENATTPSLCCAPPSLSWHENASCFRILHPSEPGPHLSETVVVSDDMLSAPTPPLHCVSIMSLTVCSPSSRCQFGVFDHLCSNLSQPHVILIPFWFLLIDRIPIFEPWCLFYLFHFCLCFSDRHGLQFCIPGCNLVSQDKLIQNFLSFFLSWVEKT